MHKAICKPGGVGKIPNMPNRLFVMDFFQLEEPEPQPAPALVPRAEHPGVSENNPEEATVEHESSDPAIGNGTGQSETAESSGEVPEHAHDGREAGEPLEQVLDSGDNTTEEASEGPSTSPAEAAQSDIQTRQDQDARLHESSHNEEEIGQEYEDDMSSPDSECSALETPLGSQNPSGPIIFGSITPDYLISLWEEEGPEALMNPGIWAKQVRLVLIPLHDSLRRTRSRFHQSL